MEHLFYHYILVLVLFQDFIFPAYCENQHTFYYFGMYMTSCVLKVSS